jgi:hypothetical protein
MMKFKVNPKKSAFLLKTYDMLEVIVYLDLESSFLINYLMA